MPALKLEALYDATWARHDSELDKNQADDDLRDCLRDLAPAIIALVREVEFTIKYAPESEMKTLRAAVAPFVEK